MKLQKWLMVLSIIAGLLIFVPFVLVVAFYPSALGWPLFDSILSLSRQALPQSGRELRSNVWWTVCTVFVIDIAYIIWYIRNRRRINERKSDQGGNRPLPDLLSSRQYEEWVSWRRQVLLAQYRDPALVQFLLNREMTRAQYLAQSLTLDDSGPDSDASAAKAKQPPIAPDDQQYYCLFTFDKIVQPQLTTEGFYAK